VDSALQTRDTVAVSTGSLTTLTPVAHSERLARAWYALATMVEISRGEFP